VTSVALQSPYIYKITILFPSWYASDLPDAFLHSFAFSLLPTGGIILSFSKSGSLLFGSAMDLTTEKSSVTLISGTVSSGRFALKALINSFFRKYNGKNSSSLFPALKSSK